MKKHTLITFCLYILFSISNICHAQVWHDMSEFDVIGTLVADSEHPYTRLPEELNGKIRDKLWALGKNSAGLSIRFATDATTISVKWDSLNGLSMGHMASTGVRGLDLYTLMPDGSWVFVGSAIPSKQNPNQSTFVKDITKEMREYMLFLSLYDGVSDLYIGTNKGAILTEPAVDLPKRDLPIIMYGTSILQGGCASRPGMAHTNILQRMLNCEVVNLGFSGNGHLDPEIAQLMAETEASVYVIDVLPNNTVTSLTNKLGPFYRILRDSHPDTPIVLVESPTYPRMKYDSGYAKGINALNRTLHDFYMKCGAEGDLNLYYVEGPEILDADGEGSVDGIHLTDLGFKNFAESMYPLLKSLLTE